MKAHILFVAKEREYTDHGPTSHREFRFRSGFNVGNWLFTSGMENMMSQFGATWTQRWFDTSDFISTESKVPFTHCIINCSNWINPTVAENILKFTRLIERSNLPTFAIGLGAQFKNEEERACLSANNEPFLAFIRAIKNSGGHYSVRGKATADLIEDWGEKRPPIFGCPSLLGHQPANAREPSTAEDTVVHGDQWLYKFDIPRNAIFIDQASLFHLCFPSRGLTRFKEFISIRPANQRLITKGDIVHLPSSLNHWAYLVATRKNCIGTRIHATILSILLGVPAVLLYHDSRTKELALFYGIPCTDISNISCAADALRVAEEIQTNKFKVIDAIEQNKHQFNRWCQTHKVPLTTSDQRLNPQNDNHQVAPYITWVEQVIVRLYLSFKGFLLR